MSGFLKFFYLTNSLYLGTMIPHTIVEGVQFGNEKTK